MRENIFAVSDSICLERAWLVTEAYRRARALVVTHVDHLHAIAQRLLEVETIDAEDLAAMMGGAQVAPATVIAGQ